MITYIPCVKIKNRYDDEIVLLKNSCFKTMKECQTWMSSRWGQWIPFGIYGEGVFVFDHISEAPFSIFKWCLLWRRDSHSWRR